VCKKVKVKCTVLQALRLCTDRTGHRGNRGIALLFLDHSIRRGWGVSVTTQPLFTPGEDPVPIVLEAGWAPGPVWTGAENLAPTRIRSRTVQPAFSRYTDWATRPTPGKRTGSHFAGWASRPVLTFAEILAPARIRSSFPPARRQSLYGLSYLDPPQRKGTREIRMLYNERTKW